MVHDNAGQVAFEAHIGEEADKPLKDSSHDDHEGVIHLLDDLFELLIDGRVGVLEELEEYFHVAHDAIHLAVVVAGEDDFGEPFEDEESFLTIKIFLQKKYNDTIHTLAVSDVRVKLDETYQHFPRLTFYFGLRSSPLEILVDDLDKVMGDFHQPQTVVEGPFGIDICKLDP